MRNKAVKVHTDGGEYGVLVPRIPVPEWNGYCIVCRYSVVENQKCWDDRANEEKRADFFIYRYLLLFGLFKTFVLVLSRKSSSNMLFDMAI